MIIPDINLLLYAYDAGSPFHTKANAFRKFSRAFVPEGHYDNSPAFQRWDRPVLCFTRPEGTAEPVECGAGAFQGGGRPSLRDFGSLDRNTQR